MLAAASIMPWLMNCLRESTRPLTVWGKGRLTEALACLGTSSSAFWRHFSFCCMAASNALESRIFTISVSRFNAVNQVLVLGVDDMESEEQKRLTKYAAWTWSRGCTGHQCGRCVESLLGGRPCRWKHFLLDHHLREKRHSNVLNLILERNSPGKSAARHEWRRLSTRFRSRRDSDLILKRQL